jgi:hypothetical protein
MVPEAELTLGSVAVVQQDGSERRIQIVGLPKLGRNGFRGFVLEPGDPPRDPQCGGNEFVDFPVDSCLRVEGQRWENHKPEVPAQLSAALA